MQHCTRKESEISNIYILYGKHFPLSGVEKECNV